MPFEAFELQEHDDDREYHNAYLEYMQSHQTDLDDFMECKAAKKKKKQQKKLSDHQR